MIKAAIRRLLRTPAHALALLATLTLGLSLTIAMFAVVHGVAFAPLPYPDDQRVVVIEAQRLRTGVAGGLTPREAIELLPKTAALQNFGWYSYGGADLKQGDRPRSLTLNQVSGEFFAVLGVAPMLGRPLTAADLGQPRTVLSHAIWQSVFGGDPEVIGKTLKLNWIEAEVVGVMPPDFAFPSAEVAIWLPADPQDMTGMDAGVYANARFLNGIARLQPQASVAQLDAELRALLPAGADGDAWVLDGERMLDATVGDRATLLLALLAVAALVLLIACANVANLFLTRLSARRRELGVRAALGASRWRIARQLLGEALILALAGGLAGVLLAYFSLGFLQVLGLDRTLLGERIGIDGTVLGFTFVVAVLTGLLFGTVPALGQDGVRASEVLRESGRSGGGRVAQRLRSVLVVVQIGLAVCLLVGAGLLLRSFDRVQQQDPGFDRQGVVTARLTLPRSRYPDTAAQAAFFERLASEMRAVPGVREVGVVSNLPFSNQNWTASYQIAGREAAPGTASPHGYLHIIDPGYFKAMGIPLLRGRSFDERDRADGAPVVMIDQYLAQKHFPNGDALGQRLVMPGINGAEESVEAEIIGIVGTVKRGQLSEDTTKETYFLSLAQYGSREAMVVLKSDLDASAALGPIQAAVQRVDPQQPVYDLKSLDARITLSLEGRMAPLILLAVFAGVALLLAAVGIYGVLAFAVQQRTGEIGVRLAIGARPADVQTLVLRQGMTLAGIGLGIGTLAALLGGSLLESQLYGIESRDPLTLGLVLALLGGAALLACWLPARRATRVAPVMALRSD